MVVNSSTHFGALQGVFRTLLGALMAFDALLARRLTLEPSATPGQVGEWMLCRATRAIAAGEEVRDTYFAPSCSPARRRQVLGVTEVKPSAPAEKGATGRGRTRVRTASSA